MAGLITSSIADDMVGVAPPPRAQVPDGEERVTIPGRGAPQPGTPKPPGVSPPPPAPGAPSAPPVPGSAPTPLVVGARAHTPTVTVAFSATPTFDAHLSNYFEFGTMTANVTGSTVINPVGGHSFSIRCVQDATGGRTFALPAGASVTGSIDTRANAVSYLQLTYSTAAARWEGTWIRITP